MPEPEESSTEEHAFAGHAGRECRTVLLQDEPSRQDHFGGAHKAIAGAVADILLTERVGGAIGIAGPWGAGKSTVIELLRGHFKTSAETHFWVFDAWAHEGDPLRRTFLETLIKSLVDKGWLTPIPFWNKRRRILAQRLKRTKNTTRPTVSKGGFLVGFGLLLVPIGTVLMDEGVERGVDFAFGTDVNWYALLGCLGLAAPALLPFLGWVALRVRQRFSASQQAVRPLLLREMFSPLANVHHIQERSNTAELGDPTSVEFARLFDRVLRTAIASETAKAERRRLVIVLDNLDRVSEEQAQRVWATLQPYTHASHKRAGLWFIATYDRDAFERLAPTVKENSPQSFLDKTIRVEFDVPVPVLSNWKPFFSELLRRAFPDHRQSDLEDAERLVSVALSEEGEFPTPRELLQIVNAIGAVHRQRCLDVALPLVAYHVIRQRQGKSVGDSVPRGIALLLGPFVEDDLFALEFGVSRPIARQLRIGEDVIDALKSGDIDAFAGIKESTEGFGDTVDILVRRRVPDWEAASPSNLLSSAAVLGASPPFPEQLALFSLVQSAARRVLRWESFSMSTDMGATCLLPDIYSTRNYIEQRFSSLHNPSGERAPLGSGEAKAIEALLRAVQVFEPIAVPVVLPGLYGDLMHGFSDEARLNRSDRIWQTTPYQGRSNDLVQWYDASPFEVHDRYLFRGLAAVNADVPWNDLLSLTSPALDEDADPDDALIVLRCLTEAIHVSEVRSHVSELVELEAIQARSKAGPVEIQASGLLLCLLTIDDDVDTSWLPKERRTLRGVGSRLFELATELGEEDRVWKLMRGAQSDLVNGFVKRSLQHDLFWTHDRLVEDVRYLSNGSVLRTVVEDQNAEGLASYLEGNVFDVRLAELYSATAERTLSPAFDSFLSAGIYGLNEAEWQPIFGNRSLARAVSALVDGLAARGVAAPGGAGLERSLLSRIPGHVPFFQAFLTALPDQSARRVKDAIYEWAANDRSVFRRAWFFKQYGQALSGAPKLHSTRAHSVSDVIGPIIQHKSYVVAALEWLAATVEQSPTLLQTKGPRIRAKLQKALVKRAAATGASENQRKAINRIRAVLDGEEL